MCLPRGYRQAKVLYERQRHQGPRPCIDCRADPPRPAFLNSKQRTNNSVGSSALSRLARPMEVDHPNAAGAHQGRERKRCSLQLLVNHLATGKSQKLAPWSILSLLCHAFSYRRMEIPVTMASPAPSSMTLRPTDVVKYDRPISRSLPTISPSG